MQDAVSAGIKLSFRKIISNLTFRQEFHSKYRVKPVFAINIKCDLINEKLFLKSSFSQNFRTPTLNDKYWMPGGNPYILPEYGWTGDAGFQYNQTFGPGHLIKAKVLYYHSSINNMIQWYPKDNSRIWEPRNSKKVWARGIESELKYDNQLSPGVIVKSVISYTFSKSTVVDAYEGPSNQIGKQLRYLPYHTGKGTFELLYKNFSFLANQVFAGLRYSDETNFMELPYYFLTNLVISYNKVYKKLTGNLSLRLDNLFNTDYRIVRAYPMPLRTYSINYKIEFNY